MGGAYLRPRMFAKLRHAGEARIGDLRLLTRSPGAQELVGQGTKPSGYQGLSDFEGRRSPGFSRHHSDVGRHDQTLSKLPGSENPAPSGAVRPSGSVGFSSLGRGSGIR